MISQQWEQVKELFEAALEKNGQDREAFLTQLHTDNPSVGDEVAKLIVSHEVAGDFLNEPWTLFPDLLEEVESEQRFGCGEVLCGRFRIVRLIGKGGMGEVYESWDQDLECAVALKTLRTEVSTHEVFTSRFRREIQLARKVTHPNVCRIFDSFKHPLGNGTYLPVVTMELLEGRTLAEYLLTKGRLSTTEALPIVNQIVEGLNAVHTAGIIHRDLKPSNLVLIPNRSGFRVKITDFGIAGELSLGDGQLSATNATKLLGTPDYMAPEQLEGRRTTLQSDIYSLGLILYEMVTGAKPFPEGTAWKRISEDPQPPKKLTLDLPERWTNAIVCCLERRPEYRFSNALAVAATLSNEAGTSRIPRKPLTVRLKALATRRGGGFVMAAVLFTMALVLLFLRYFKQSAEIPAGTTVLVTDIATTDPTLSGITLAVKSQLAQSAHFEIEPDSKVLETLKQMNRKLIDPMDRRTAREVALRTGIPLVIYGSVASTHSGPMLSMRIERVKYNPFFPAAIWKRDFPANDRNGLLDAVHDASDWVRKMAGESAADLAQQDRPVEDTTTGSWQALQLFTQAEKSDAAGNHDIAVLLIREALLADPEFATGHMRLADILISQKQYAEGYSEWQKAIELATKHQITSRESIRIQGQYYEDTGDYVQAEKIFHEYTIHYPNDYLAWFFWASLLDTLERKEEALSAFKESLLRKPDSPVVRAHIAMVQLVLGHYDEAGKVIAEISKIGDRDLAAWLSANSAFLQHDLQTAEHYVMELASSASDYWRSQSFTIKARFLAESGQYNEAAKSLEAGLIFDKSRSRAVDQSDKYVSLAYLAYRRGNTAECRRRALDALQLDDTPRQSLEAGPLLARSGDLRSVGELLRKLANQPEIYRVRLAKLRLKGEIELAMHHKEKALRYLQHASALARPNEAQSYFASALLILGRFKEAEPILTQTVNEPARLMLYPDNSLPGLWADALVQLTLHSPTGMDGTLCSYGQEFLVVRNHPDSGLIKNEVQKVRDRVARFCQLDTVQ